MSTDTSQHPGHLLGEAGKSAAGGFKMLASAFSDLTPEPSRAGFRARRRKGGNVATNIDRQKVNAKNRRHKANKAARRARKKNRR